MTLRMPALNRYCFHWPVVKFQKVVNSHRTISRIAEDEVRHGLQRGMRIGGRSVGGDGTVGEGPQTQPDCEQRGQSRSQYQSDDENFADGLERLHSQALLSGSCCTMISAGMTGGSGRVVSSVSVATASSHSSPARASPSQASLTFSWSTLFSCARQYM